MYAATLAVVFFLLSSSFHLRQIAVACNLHDRASLLSFHRLLHPPLNWSAAADCCLWEGVACSGGARVSRLSVPNRGLAGTIPPSLSNLTSLVSLNLSGNKFSGALPPAFFHGLSRLQVLDLSSNRFSGELDGLTLPASIRAVDLSNNLFAGAGALGGSFLRSASGLVSFNVSKNSFAGAVDFRVICNASPLLEVLDLSSNEFSGELPEGLSGCSGLQILRAGFNRLTGNLPADLYSVKALKEISLSNNRFSGPIAAAVAALSNLTILELQVNALTGEIPPEIGRLSQLEQLQLHSNSFNGSLPAAMADCRRLSTLLLRNNNLTGEISAVDFSNLGRLQTVDLGNNTFSGEIPATLCLCRSLTAVRLAYNKFSGELPPCVASLRSLQHLSLSDNYLSNVAGALKILNNCRNITVLFLSRCFDNESMPQDSDFLHLTGFRNLQILTLGGCRLEGRIPSWIAKLKNLKVLNLSYNRISGPIPSWLGKMPSLFVLNLTKNSLSGELPRELARLPALITDNSTSDLSYLALPFLFDKLQYNRLFNLPRGLKVGFNNLSGAIPPEIARLKLLHLLDLNDNNFTGTIPPQLSRLTNLERLDLSGNRLSGEIPGSLAGLHFLSSFSVANNDLEGEIPRGGQFDTFPAASFDGNPKLCGYLLRRSCSIAATPPGISPDKVGDSWWRNVPFGTGYSIGFLAVIVVAGGRSFRGMESSDSADDVETRSSVSRSIW
ncbi:tyrosine-sulfated glycopeptide receptor 1-like [Andrographis paniculata]|uniref:tyrosine-sulfated glycopeptide receptor 1-like n=1 Tax=Andrographis paniculata TaxID=175694 RepID=UPI0021E967FE|nr:tyrosine-sulfated glycopeptide receptor 1-like [Andrographis paniculata]